MTTNPLVPAEGVPLRQVEAWTQVPGHNVVADRSMAFCSCGQRVPRDWAGSGRKWRDAHLREAWPVLVPRLAEEPQQEWLHRIASAHSEALQAEGKLHRDLGLDQPVGAGQPYPVITDEYGAAAERVEVLQHQMDEVRAKLNQ